MQISLMTLNMFIRIFYQFYMYRDLEECKELYEEMMAMTRECGIETVELTCRETRLFGLDYVNGVLQKHHLSVGGYMHMDDLDDSALNVAAAVDIAKAVGADTLMLIPYWHDSLEGRSGEEIHRIYADRWREAVQKAIDAQIQIVVEDTPDQRLHLCRAEDMKHFFSLLPQAKLVYDSGNMILAGEDPIAYAQTMHEYIACVHLKDMREISPHARGADISFDGRGMTSARTGDGSIPLEPVIQELKKQGYNGRWVIELSMDGSNSYPQAVCHAMAKVGGWLLE